MSACESAENAGKCAEAKRRADSAKPNPKGAQASARLAAELAAHPFSPRTAPQSRDCHRVRVRRGCTAISAPSALSPGISRRCTWRSDRSDRAQRAAPWGHFAVARALGFACAATLGCTSTLRRLIRSPIRAVRLRAEYRPLPHDAVSPASDASRHPCALGSPVALHLSLSRYMS